MESTVCQDNYWVSKRNNGLTFTYWWSQQCVRTVTELVKGTMAWHSHTDGVNSVSGQLPWLGIHILMESTVCQDSYWVNKRNHGLTLTYWWSQQCVLTITMAWHSHSDGVNSVSEQLIWLDTHILMESTVCQDNYYGLTLTYWWSQQCVRTITMAWHSHTDGVWGFVLQNSQQLEQPDCCLVRSLLPQVNHLLPNRTVQ